MTETHIMQAAFLINSVCSKISVHARPMPYPVIGPFAKRMLDSVSDFAQQLTDNPLLQKREASHYKPHVVLQGSRDYDGERSERKLR